MNLDDPIRTKNLAEEDPAAMDDILDGYAWLPRMIDKARAARAGKLGNYYKFPCPIDQHCLGLLGITPEMFASVAMGANTGRDLLTVLRDAGLPSPSEASFDPVMLNRSFHGQDQSHS